MSLPQTADEGRRLLRLLALFAVGLLALAGCTVGDVEGAAAPASGDAPDLTTAEPATDHTDEVDLLDAQTYRVSLTRDPLEPLLVPAEAPADPADPDDPTADPVDPDDPDADPVDPDDPDADPDDPVAPDDLPPDPKEGPVDG